MCSDPAFLARLSGELQKKQDILSSIQTMLPAPEEMDEYDIEDLAAVERIDTFFARLSKRDSDEAMKEAESPAARRARIKRGTRDGVIKS
jgi:hypothetical protein